MRSTLPSSRRARSRSRSSPIRSSRQWTAAGTARVRASGGSAGRLWVLPLVIPRFERPVAFHKQVGAHRCRHHGRKNIAHSVAVAELPTSVELAIDAKLNQLPQGFGTDADEHNRDESRDNVG